MTGYPSPEDVARIARVPDLVLRNLQVTQGYYELSAAMHRLLPGTASWVTFATWASKQAGQTIRYEDMRRVLERRMERHGPVGAALGELTGFLDQRSNPVVRVVGRVVDQIGPLRRASAAVSRGNIKVFSEIGFHFSRVLGALGGAPQTLAAVLDGLAPGPPPDGQDHLRRAFRAYVDAIAAPAPKPRAELILLANANIGYHEQIRLQDEIQEALEASAVSIELIKERLAAAFVTTPSLVGSVTRGVSRIRKLALERLAARLAPLVRDLIRAVTTEHLMSIWLPGSGVLRLGRDLTGPFPPSLAVIDGTELRAFLARVDPTPDSLRASGARDWADFPERIHFIVDLFRLFQESPDLMLPPFTAEQTAAIKADRIPEGAL